MITKELRDELMELGETDPKFFAGYLCGLYDGVHDTLNHLQNSVDKAQQQLYAEQKEEQK